MVKKELCVFNRNPLVEKKSKTDLYQLSVMVQRAVSTLSKAAPGARFYLYLESAVNEQRWVRRVQLLTANRDLSRQGSQESPYVLATIYEKDTTLYHSI